MNSGRPLSFETSTSFGGHFPAPKKRKKNVRSHWRKKIAFQFVKSDPKLGKSHFFESCSVT